MRHPIERERGKKYVGLPEFARACEAVLSELGFEQQRGTVSLVPDERTIRYYITEGLIQSSDEKQGTASVFGYLQVLQLVAVKKLQAEHLPIRKIRELVAGKDENQLESLLGVGNPAGSKTGETEAKRYLASLLAPSMSADERLPGPSSFEQKIQEERSALASAPPQATASWQRVEIEPGLELHIRSDYLAPKSSARTKGLAERIRGAISRYWRDKR